MRFQFIRLRARANGRELVDWLLSETPGWSRQRSMRDQERRAQGTPRWRVRAGSTGSTSRLGDPLRRHQFARTSTIATALARLWRRPGAAKPALRARTVRAQRPWFFPSNKTPEPPKNPPPQKKKPPKKKPRTKKNKKKKTPRHRNSIETHQLGVPQGADAHLHK